MNALQERYSEMLSERILDDEYPSVTQMDLFEAFAPPRQLLAYTLGLMDKLEHDERPSIDMMRRVQRLILRFHD